MADLETAAKRRKFENDPGVEDDLVPWENGVWTERTERFSSMVTVDGDVYPQFPVQISPEQHIRDIRNMAMRDDDVIIAGFPCSGSRWVLEMVQMLVRDTTDHDTRCKEDATIELNNVTQMESIPSPRVMTSHLFLRQLSNEIVAKQSRVIHVLRNPKDLAVSYYFLSKQMSSFKDMDFQEFAVDFINSAGCQGTFMDYFTYMYEMKKWRRQNPDVPFISVYYEDIQKNPAQCVRRLARFLTLNHVTDALSADIAEQCCFHKLKWATEHVKSHQHPSRILFRDYSPNFFRKGEVGDWKNHFTMAASELYDTVIQDRLADCDLSFQYII